MPAKGSPHELADGKVLLDWPADHVARLTIANPAKKGALDHPILDGIAATVLGLAGTEARCLIVTGTPGSFSAGYDIGDIPDDEFVQRAEQLVAHPFTAAIDALESFPFPTLAALSGPAIGGGLELAVACDLRIAAEDVRMGMPPARLGLVYSHTGLRRFIETVGAARTRELFLLGRYVDAGTALSWGLVNFAVPAVELPLAAVALAAEIAGHAPLALRGNKQVIADLLEHSATLPSEVEEELIARRRESFASLDMREGVRAFTEKRPPRWQGR
jgi:enoyl-CoA hydratase/carnithine racemase